MGEEESRTFARKPIHGAMVNVFNFILIHINISSRLNYKTINDLWVSLSVRNTKPVMA